MNKTTLGEFPLLNFISSPRLAHVWMGIDLWLESNYLILSQDETQQKKMNFSSPIFSVQEPFHYNGEQQRIAELIRNKQLDFLGTERKDEKPNRGGHREKPREGRTTRYPQKA